MPIGCKSFIKNGIVVSEISPAKINEVKRPIITRAKLVQQQRVCLPFTSKLPIGKTTLNSMP